MPLRKIIRLRGPVIHEQDLQGREISFTTFL
jgi:hypothetical protein